MREYIKIDQGYGSNSLRCISWSTYQDAHAKAADHQNVLYPPLPHTVYHNKSKWICSTHAQSMHAIRGRHTTGSSSDHRLKISFIFLKWELVDSARLRPAVIPAKVLKYSPTQQSSSYCESRTSPPFCESLVILGSASAVDSVWYPDSMRSPFIFVGSCAWAQVLGTLQHKENGALVSTVPILYALCCNAQHGSWLHQRQPD